MIHFNRHVIEIISVNSDVTLSQNSTHLVDTSSARALTLPAPYANLYIAIKDVTGSAQTNNITIVRNGSEKIEGLAASKILQTNWGSWCLFSDGTDWFIGPF